MESVIELAVHLEKFRNIDLFKQGLYRVRGRVFTRKPENPEDPKGVWVKDRVAFPYTIVDLNEKEAHATWPVAFIDNRQHYFSSTAVRIQYCDQVLTLNDCCAFRLHVNSMEVTHLFLEIELMFAEYSASRNLDKEMPTDDDFTVLSTKLLEIPSLVKGNVHAARPVTFDDAHFCMVETMVHAAVIDFKLQQQKKDTGIFSEAKYLSRDERMQQLIFRKMESNPDNYDPRDHEKFILPLKEVCEVADKYHAFFFGTLVQSYVSMAEFFRTMLNLGWNDVLEAKPNLIWKVRGLALPASMFNLQNDEKWGEKVIKQKHPQTGIDMLIFRPKRNETYQLPRLIKLSQRCGYAGRENVEYRSSMTRPAEEDENEVDKLVSVDVAAAKADNTVDLAEVKSDLSKTLLGDCREVAGQLFQIWHEFMQLSRLCGPSSWTKMYANYNKVVLDYSSTFVFRERYVAGDRLLKAKDEMLGLHSKICKVVRKTNNHQVDMSPMLREVTEEYPENAPAVVLFEEAYDDEPKWHLGHSHDTSKRPSLHKPLSFDNPLDAQIKEEQQEASPGVEGKHDKAEEGGEQKKKLSASAESKGPGLITDRAELERLSRDKVRHKEQYVGANVFIFVHGYQANSWDMRLFKNQILLMCPEAICKLSTSNEHQTEGDIRDMGKRLANEVHAFLKDVPGVGRITFVCHSLGGLITRAALTHDVMKEYLPHLYTYVSLAVPHCGYLYGDSSMLSGGLWFLKKWNKSTCLSQMSFTDAEEPEDTFLYKLSLEKGLEYFEHVFLLASGDDKYAPFHSARLEHVPISRRENSVQGHLFDSIVDNILQPLPHVVMKRIHLNFPEIKRSLDSFIGRTAHIFFLDRAQYMSMLITIYKDYF